MERHRGDDGVPASTAGSSSRHQRVVRDNSGDVREDVSAHLNWEFSYASTDPMEARCLVAIEAGGQNAAGVGGTVAEWLVRKFTDFQQPRITDVAHEEAAVAAADTAVPLHEAKSHKVGGGLESQLENELWLSKGQAATGDEQNKWHHKNEQMSSLARLECLYSDIPYYEGSSAQVQEVQRGLFMEKAAAKSSHLSPLRGVCKLPSSDEDAGKGPALAVFEYEKYSLQDVLKYNRHVLHDDEDAQGEELALSDLKKRFLVYQLHRILQFLDQHGLACGGFTPSDILLTDTLWIRLGSLPFTHKKSAQGLQAPGASAAERETHETINPSLDPVDVCRTVSSLSSRSVTEQWCDGDLSNFDYLMLLNHAAGRRMIDGVFHPFLPWVTDFRSQNAGWRDLSKSKFRLNKGDNQLDRTFENSSVPHHITESLSEITYYIYMARRTPMLVLRKVVRSNFQPKEYPSNMSRMYDWTPDECIPEFYTEPRVFQSIHGDDMDDLKLPAWCEDAQDFIRSHRDMLESAEVSRQLHHWIDLNFGVSLSGDQAVKQKNVPLKAQSKTRLGKSPGFVQIFHVPHPARKARIGSFSDPQLHGAAQQTDKKDNVQRDRVRFSTQAAYRPSDTKKKVTGMLAKALLIMNDSAEGLTKSTSAVFDSFRVAQSNNSKANASVSQSFVASSSESKTRMKQKRKTKSRPRSHGSDPPSPSALKDGSVKSPTVSRLATVIPNFFHPDSTYTHTPSSASANSGGPGNKPLNGAEASLSSMPPAIPGGSRSVTQDAEVPGADKTRIPTISAPLIHGVSGDNGASFHSRTTPSGASTSPSSTSHIFRDLWQQLSKPDDFESDFAGENSGHHHVLDYDWSEIDFERVDEMDLQLLSVGLPIKVPSPNPFQGPTVATTDSAQKHKAREYFAVAERDANERPVNPETRANLRRMSEAIIDPAYSLPRGLLDGVFPDSANLTDLETRRADDLFSLGCIIAEIYTLAPLFSKRSIVKYINGFGDSDRPDSSNASSYWSADVTSKMLGMPVNMKNAVLALIHPNPRERLLMAGVLDGDEVFSLLKSLECHSAASGKHQPQYPLNPILESEFSPAQFSLFPEEFVLVYRFLFQFHRSSDWKDRLDATRLFMPSLVQLPLQHFRVVLPVITQFFQASSHTEPIRVERVVMAVIFLLPSLSTQLGKLGMKQELLQDVVRAYESSELTHLLKICLSDPEVLKELVKSFGTTAFVECLLPVLVDWLASAPTHGIGDAMVWPPPSLSFADGASRPVSKIPLFAPEACSITAIALGELSSPEMLGPSLASKYILVSILPHLGKGKNKWTKLTKSSTLRKKGSGAYGAGDDSSDELLLSGMNNDGIHVTFLSKAVLYESHYVADATLLICREVGEYPVCNVLLPHVFEVLPQLITLAEKIGSVRVEGVPDDLGREIYVILRILRHVVRNLSEVYVQDELLNRKGKNLVDMLDTVEPPFLHPRTAAAIIAAATSSSSADVMGSHKANHRDMQSLSRNVNPMKRSILRSLVVMKKENHRDLRAFTAVGLARTIVAVCQRIGPDATVNATSLVQAVNKFLTRCSVVYSELEVSNFQWHLASEVVSEFCVPLRNLLGKEMFVKYFPVVQRCSVLQLLLLPIGDVDNSSHVLSTLDDRLAPSHRGQLSHHESVEYQDESDLSSRTTVPIDTEWTCTDKKLKSISRYPQDLVRFAYRTTRLNSVKATSFLQIPLNRLQQQNAQDLNDEVFQVQESRRKRSAALSNAFSLSSPAQRMGFDSAWLRPLTKRPFSSKAAAGEDGGANTVSGGGGSRHFLPPTASMAPRSGRNGILASWAFTSEIRSSIKAHSSSIRTMSVDLDEEILLSGSKNGSCRAWRLASHPCYAQAAIQTNSPVLAVQSVMDGTHAIALEASCVHVWDLRTSQVRVKLPFIDDNVNSVTLLRTLPSLYHSHAGLPNISSFGDASATLGSADFAVSTTRKVVCVDLRAGPRVVADWRVDVRDAINISTLATVFSATTSRSQACIAAGTTNGTVILIDRRTGKHLVKWQALDGKIAKLVQVSPSQLLVVGVEREARVWNIAALDKPRAQLIVSGFPEGIRESQVAVQTYADMSVLYITSGSKMFATRLTSESDALRSSSTGVTVPTVRMEAWNLMETAVSSSSSSSSLSAITKLSKSKVSSQSICVLPLRRLIVVGSEDGFLKCVI